MQNTLDLSIKKDELRTISGGYGKYQAYMDENVWELFIEDMKKKHPSAYEQYGAGAGGELNPTGNLPPKMASYGSSSRMIYNLSKHIPDFYFEYKLPTTVGGVANMDGYVELADKHIFVEAKCREPYNAKSVTLSEKYKSVYKYLNDSDNPLSVNYSTKDGKTTVEFSVGTTQVRYLDVKQIICHLLGIATRFLTYPSAKSVCFVYLCFSPAYIKILDPEKEDKIFEVYEHMCEEFCSLDIKAIFADIVRYLSEKHRRICNITPSGISALIDGFNSILCDQVNYVSVLRK
jgi:hypothetical protein